ncbi:steroid hormone receptor ERR1-like [Antedon mediterranea]|uniref:steroid hormone receptor ERR1-like n=1 Tax=Antedon mediterranea TaxID=105859 RepID=UPI003AF6D69F
MMSSSVEVYSELISARLTLSDENCNSSASGEDEVERSVRGDGLSINYDHIGSPEIGFTPKTEMNDLYPVCEEGLDSSHASEPLKKLRSHTKASSKSVPIDSENKRRLCVVCGDYASGYHYGIASCEACKAFFKRTVQGRIEYACPSNNNCEITKKGRKTCQACRYQKCIEMGMLVEGVRPNRVRGGRQKYRRKPEETDFGPSPSSKRAKTKKLNELTQLLLRIDAPIVKLDVDPNIDSKDPTYRAVKIVADIADKDLKFTVNWAKKIPGFRQLPMTDQMSLLQGAWMEILIIGLLYRSIHLTNPDRILFTENFIMSRADSKLNGFDSLADRCLYLVRRMREMDIQKEEYVLLKAIALVNADATDVVCTSGLEQLELRIYDALHEFIQTNYPATCARREMKLITMLPGFRQLSNDSIKHFSKNFVERNVPMRELFREMMEAKHDCI